MVADALARDAELPRELRPPAAGTTETTEAVTEATGMANDARRRKQVRAPWYDEEWLVREETITLFVA